MVRRRFRSLVPQRGFTLVELALSAALIGIIASSLALIFKVSLDLVNSSDERNELVQEARNSMNRIVTELKHATNITRLRPNFMSFDTIYLSGVSTETRHIAYNFNAGTVYRSVDYGPWQPLVEKVPDFRLGGITLRTTLDDPASVTFPEIGPSGMLNGNYGFVPMKFNSGFFSHKDFLISGVTFPASNVVYRDQGQ